MGNKIIKKWKTIHLEIQLETEVPMKNTFCSVDFCDVQPMSVSDGLYVSPFSPPEPHAPSNCGGRGQVTGGQKPVASE